MVTSKNNRDFCEAVCSEATKMSQLQTPRTRSSVKESWQLSPDAFTPRRSSRQTSKTAALLLSKTTTRARKSDPEENPTQHASSSKRKSDTKSKTSKTFEDLNSSSLSSTLSQGSKKVKRQAPNPNSNNSPESLKNGITPSQDKRRSSKRISSQQNGSKDEGSKLSSVADSKNSTASAKPDIQQILQQCDTGGRRRSARKNGSQVTCSLTSPTQLTSDSSAISIKRSGRRSSPCRKTFVIDSDSSSVDNHEATHVPESDTLQGVDTTGQQNTDTQTSSHENNCTKTTDITSTGCMPEDNPINVVPDILVTEEDAASAEDESTNENITQRKRKSDEMAAPLQTKRVCIESESRCKEKGVHLSVDPSSSQVAIDASLSQQSNDEHTDPMDKVLQDMAERQPSSVQIVAGKQTQDIQVQKRGKRSTRRRSSFIRGRLSQAATAVEATMDLSEGIPLDLPQNHRLEILCQKVARHTVDRLADEFCELEEDVAFQTQALDHTEGVIIAMRQENIFIKASMKDSIAPHPENLALEDKITALQNTIAKLKGESRVWDELIARRKQLAEEAEHQVTQGSFTNFPTEDSSYQSCVKENIDQLLFAKLEFVTLMDNLNLIAKGVKDFENSSRDLVQKSVKENASALLGEVQNLNPKKLIQSILQE